VEQACGDAGFTRWNRPLPSEWLAYDYQLEDLHKLADIARASQAISTPHDGSGGDPSSSPRWRRYIAPYGGDQ
jgi:hypothetical protein